MGWKESKLDGCQHLQDGQRGCAVRTVKHVLTKEDADWLELLKGIWGL